MEQLEREHRELAAEATQLLASLGRHDDCWRHNHEGLATEGTWSECTLIELGVVNQTICDRVPRTCTALQALQDSRRPELSSINLCRFSVLQGETHLWPHCGPTNARLRLHLPLYIPEGDFRLVVGETEHRWRTGKAVLFDDSFRHEVFARPADAGAQRVVLIVDVWHPVIHPSLLSSHAAAMGLWFRVVADLGMDVLILDVYGRISP